MRPGGRGRARGVPGGATASPKFCVPPPKFSAWHHATGVGLFLKVLHRPLTAPLVAKLAPPVAPSNENVWLCPCILVMNVLFFYTFPLPSTLLLPPCLTACSSVPARDTPKGVESEYKWNWTIKDEPGFEGSATRSIRDCLTTAW